MSSKQIIIITENEFDFHVRKAWLLSHKVRWLLPGPKSELSNPNDSGLKPDLVIIEGEEGVKWLGELRTDLEIPTIIISWESPTSLQAQFARRIAPSSETLKSKMPILEFGKHGVYYLPKPMRLEQLNATIEACSAVTDYGDTQQQLALHQTVQWLQNFSHNSLKRVDRIQLRLSSICNAFSMEKWEKAIASLQSLRREIDRSLRQLRHAGLDVERQFPDEVEFKQKCASLLKEWQGLTNPEMTNLGGYLHVLSKMAKVFTHPTKEGENA